MGKLLECGLSAPFNNMRHFMYVEHGYGTVKLGNDGEIFTINIHKCLIPIFGRYEVFPFHPAYTVSPFFR
jgi:hypothetical protein